MATTGKSRSWCSAPNCKNGSLKTPDLSFYRFPKDKERCAAWVQNVRRMDLFKRTPEYLHQNCRLCSNHFEDSQILMSGRLVWNAIPTLFNGQNSSKRKLPTRREDSARAKAKEKEVVEGKAALDELVKHHTYANSSNAELFSPSQENWYMLLRPPRVPVPPETESAQPGNDTSPTQVPNRTLNRDPQSLKERAEIYRLRAQVAKLQDDLSRGRRKARACTSTLRVKVYRLKKRVLKLKARLKEEEKVRNVTLDEIIEGAGKYLSGTSLQLFSSQLRIAQRRMQGRRYTREDKLLALNLYRQNRTAYDFCRKIFALPSKRILRRAKTMLEATPTTSEEPRATSCTEAAVNTSVAESDLISEMLTNPVDAQVGQMPLLFGDQT